MRIGIVTQPQWGNFGGILQNWALQQVFKRLGYEPITIDYLWGPKISIWKFVRKNIKAAFFYTFSKRRCRFVGCRYASAAKWKCRRFVRKNIHKTHVVLKYEASVLAKYKIDMLVAGSDQIWRPQYNLFLDDMYLKFASDVRMPKIAYGASFGVSGIEYTDDDVNRCLPYARKIDAVSVRESSGVNLCSRYFGIDAVKVLDPTLLLKKEDYIRLSSRRFSLGGGKLLDNNNIYVYLLDDDERYDKIIDRCLSVLKSKKVIRVRENSSIENWLRGFQQAELVLTDSFHGTVFSLLFGIPFITFANADRGNDRFESLLKPLDLMNRFVTTSDADYESIISTSIDWAMVNTYLDSERSLSLKFITDNLKNRCG